MGCILDIDNIVIRDEPYVVFFSSDGQVVYKQKNSIVLETEESNILDTAPAPLGYRNFEYASTSSHHVFFFSGRHFLLLDKLGHTQTNGIRSLNPLSDGRCISKIFVAPDDDLVFAVSARDHIHLVKYNPISEARSTQTSSYKLDRLSDLAVEGQIAYALLDDSFIICADMSTGEVTRTIFEASHVPSKLIVDNGKVAYFTHSILKVITNEGQDKIQFPSMKVHSVEAQGGNRIIVTTHGGTELVCAHMATKEIEWSTTSQSPILESLVVTGQKNGKNKPILIARLAKGISIIDASTGNVIKNVFMDQIYRIRQTDNHILLHKANNTTSIIRGIRQ